MTFYDHEFQNVALGIGNDFPVRHFWLREHFFRYNLMRDNFDDADFFRRSILRARHFEVSRRAITQVHRAARLVRSRTGGWEIFSVLRDERTLLVDTPDFELGQVVHYDEVRPVAWRDRALVLQAVIASSVNRSHLDRGHWRHAERNRFPDRVIYVAFIHKIARQFVVGRE